MATKRTATRELNHENWNAEEEPEDAGTFRRAPADVLQKRVIKTARRRNPILSVQDSDDPDTPKNNVFGGFTGFKKRPAPATAAFSFLSNSTNDKQNTPKTNGMSSETKPTFKTPRTEKSQSKDGNDEEYLAKLKGLNESVAKWIQKHVEENPFINLTPIFKDYERYFSELENHKDTKTSQVKDSSFKFKPSESDSNKMSTLVFKPQTPNDTSATISQSPSSNAIIGSGTSPFSSTTGKGFSFGSSKVDEKKDNNPTATASKGFSFGSSKSDENKAEAPSFKFGSAPVTTGTFVFNSSTPFGASTTSSTGFSFSGSSPFTFKNTSAPTTNSTETQERPNEDEDEPPKVEFKAVEEEGHVYKIRCKVFVKKDSNYVDRGVGNLFLKPIEGKDKMQLIVRADTNLGNLLCNFILSEGIPMQRIGTRDVMLVCLPTPDEKPPPTPILLRVKSTEEADELLKTLEKYKK